MGPSAHGPQGDPLSQHPASASAAAPVLVSSTSTDPTGAGDRARPAGPLEARVASRRRRLAADSTVELVAAARKGDRDAFDELVRATYVETYTLAHRLTGDADTAADVVQETYLRAYRSLGAFRGDARFTTWLYRITANCASTHLGRRRRHRHEELTDDLAVRDLRPLADPGGSAERSVLRDHVRVALTALPPRLRAVVVLRDVYDLPHEAIAAELGISVSAAKVRLHRARRKLRDDVCLRALAGREGVRRAL